MGAEKWLKAYRRFKRGTLHPGEKQRVGHGLLRRRRAEKGASRG